MDRDFAEITAVDVPSGLTSDPESESEAEVVPIAARRADALTEIAETYMTNIESSGSTADRYQVVVHVAADQVSLGRTSSIENGPGVTAVTSRRIACDSSVVCIKEDENGEPLSIGRRSRSIPPPMRRALRARDNGCRFPGCTDTRFVDGHHIQHWADGGETSLDNLILLCRRHHHLVHEGDLLVTRIRAARSRSKINESSRSNNRQDYRVLPPTMIFNNGLIVSSSKPILIAKPVLPDGMPARGWIGKRRCRRCSDIARQYLSGSG